MRYMAGALGQVALGQTLSARGRGGEAVAHLRKSVSMSPQDPSAMVELALSLHRQGVCHSVCGVCA